MNMYKGADDGTRTHNPSVVKGFLRQGMNHFTSRMRSQLQLRNDKYNHVERSFNLWGDLTDHNLLK